MRARIFAEGRERCDWTWGRDFEEVSDEKFRLRTDIRRRAQLCNDMAVTEKRKYNNSKQLRPIGDL